MSAITRRENDMISVIKELSLLAGIICVIVLCAITWDFVVGWRKAKERGEARTSYAMSRTATKLVTYYGAMGVGFSIDLLLNVGQLWAIVGIERLAHVPIVLTLISVFLCIVELVSIQESADTKLKKRMEKAGGIVMTAAGKVEIAKAIAEAIKIATKDINEQDEGIDIINKVDE